MIDPVTMTAILKGLDLAFLAIDMVQQTKAMTADSDPIKDAIRDLREGVLTGKVDAAEASADLDALIGKLQQRRRDAFNALPRPTFGQQLDD